ncbi:MAG: HAD family hydrolase [Acetobacteraceae bacterium]|nr:HAD family hydrolase [Acetobacteraceae bacterium]
MLFDFARTLVWAPSWEELEIRRLARACLEVLSSTLGRPELVARLREAHELYLGVRQEGRRTAQERPAVDSVLDVLERMGLGGLVPFSRVAEVVEDLNRACLEDTAPLPGARETLECLTGRGLSLGLVSNATCAWFVPRCLERHGMNQYLGVQAVSGACGVRKPAPEIFRLALDGLGVAPHEAVMVGDSLAYDVAGARRAGLKALWLEAGTLEPAPLPPGLAPDARLKRLDPGEVLKLISGW